MFWKTRQWPTFVSLNESFIDGLPIHRQNKKKSLFDLKSLIRQNYLIRYLLRCWQIQKVFFLLLWSQRIRDNGWLGTFSFALEVCFREIYLIFIRHFTLNFMKYFSFENFSKRHKTLFVRVWREKKVSNHSCNSW